MWNDRLDINRHESKCSVLTEPGTLIRDNIHQLLKYHNVTAITENTYLLFKEDVFSGIKIPEKDKAHCYKFWDTVVKEEIVGQSPHHHIVKDKAANPNDGKYSEFSLLVFKFAFCKDKVGGQNIVYRQADKKTGCCWDKIVSIELFGK